jgi:hypothetical protein
MPFDPAQQKQMLDWLTGGASVTKPNSRFVSFATASPTSVSDFTGPIASRRSCTFAGANSPNMSATNVAVISCSIQTAATFVGWNLFNSSALGTTLNGTRLAWGTLSASIGCAAGDTLGFAAGALKITLT